MEKTQDSGLTCFMIVMKFHGIPITKEQAENLSVLDPEQKTGEIEIIESAKKLKMRARFCRLNINKLKNINAPIIAKDSDGEFFIIAKSTEDKFMILFADKTQPAIKSREELAEIWDGTAVIISKKGIADREAIFSFKWFIPTILKFKKEFIQVLIAVFTVQILGILTPVMTQVVVDKVLVHRSMSTLNVLAIGIGIVYVYELILGLAKNYVFTHTTNRIDVMLSFKLFRHLFALPLKYFESRRVGETVARVRELDSIRNFLTGTPLSSMIDLIFIIVYIVVLFFYSPMLIVIVICSIPVYAVLSAIVTPLFKKRLDEKFETGANTQSFLVESITGVQTVKSYALEPKFEKKWGDLQSDYVKASYKTSMVSATAGTTGQFIQKVFDLLILFFGAKAVMDGNFTVGQLVAFRMLSGRVSGPVLRLVQLWQEYQQASLSVKRIGDIFNTAPEPILNTNQTSMPKINGKIVFDKVRFRYNPQGGEVIKGMSFEIEPDTIVGVVGRSGSGKSTVSKLIQRLYIPEGGKISIDGMDISLVNPAMLRKQIGVVLQENFMFNGTVAENISIHCPAASMDQIINSAKIAGAHDFILELPDGYNTIIGEKGMGLSGGQKQRVAIARAILNNPRILIFDEATSALDYESESIIQNNLKEICKGRTVLIIAHRLSTLKDANKIMVIDRGNLVEYDAHENLMEQKAYISTCTTNRNEVTPMNNTLTEYVLEHGKKRDKELKYDFMPSLLEIIERPAHKAGTVIIIGIFTLLIGAIIWACVSEIDVVITASGSVQPIGNLNVVKTYSGGTVKSINVSEGDFIERGDVLIELDSEALEIDVDQLKKQQKILESQWDIYTKITGGSDLSKIKISDYSDELKPYIQAIIDENKGYKNTLVNLENEKKSAEINRDIAQLQLEQYQSTGGTERQIKAQELSVQQYALAVDNAELQISNTEVQYSSQVNSNISEIGSKLDEIETNLDKYRLSTEYQNITAPVSGYVNSVGVNTLGETVTSAQQLVTIVPGNTPNEMLCYVKNTDIADVELGMEAEIKLEAYPYNKYGTVKGKVKYISPSSFANEQLGSVYIVKLELDGSNEKIHVISGLSGAVEIKTDKRTVMDYFLEPIVKGFGESLKEK